MADQGWHQVLYTLPTCEVLSPRPASHSEVGWGAEFKAGGSKRRILTSQPHWGGRHCRKRFQAQGSIQRQVGARTAGRTYSL